MFTVTNSIVHSRANFMNAEERFAQSRQSPDAASFNKLHTMHANEQLSDRRNISARTQSRKRKYVSNACRKCRSKRTKCDGLTPCSLCTSRGFECVYDYDGRGKDARLQRFNDHVAARMLQEHSSSGTSNTLAKKAVNAEIALQQIGGGDLLVRPNLSDRATAHEEIVELLANLPENEAQRVMQSIRARIDIATIVSHVKAADPVLQLVVEPETRYRYEFPYRMTMPEDCVSNNPYLDSLLHEASSLYSTDIPSRNKLLDRSASLNSNIYQDLYFKPFHAAEVVDPLLSSARISSWTRVCVDDKLMRHLLSKWLICEYHFTAAFQKDLFLEDMASQREDFCSSLLVNIVLAYSCTCYAPFSDRAEYWNPNTLTYRFVAEAKRLWELEADKPKITTIQAGILFNVYYNLCGLDEVGQSYRIQAISLATEMRLLEGARAVQNHRIYHGRLFSAWALFNWETLVSFSFMVAPLLSKPPDGKLPDPSDESGWYGEIWMKYPMNNTLLPSYLGQVLKARSQFRIVMNSICQELYAEGTEVTLTKACEFLSELRCWYDGLPAPLLPETISLPGHLQLHMYYHHLILTIFEPLLDTKTDGKITPRQVVTDARKYLQTLLRLYYLRHGYEAMDLFVVIPLMLIAFGCIDAIKKQIHSSELESLRSTLILTTIGLYKQRRNHHLAGALFRIVRGRMRVSEVALLRGIIEIDDDNKDDEAGMTQPVRSRWPVSVVRRKEDFDFHILTNLVESFANLNSKKGTTEEPTLTTAPE